MQIVVFKQQRHLWMGMLGPMKVFHTSVRTFLGMWTLFAYSMDTFFLGSVSCFGAILIFGFALGFALGFAFIGGSCFLTTAVRFLFTGSIAMKIGCNSLVGIL